jgi:hypothetical protein
MLEYLLSYISIDTMSITYTSLLIFFTIPIVSPTIIQKVNTIISRPIKKVTKITEEVFVKSKVVFKICSILSKTLFSYFYLRTFQYFNSSVKQLDKNLFEVQYIVKGKLYKMLVKPNKGPCPVLQIVDQNLEDVTDIILPYFGPSYNWKHAQEIDLKHLNVTSLTFEFSDGTNSTVTAV